MTHIIPAEPGTHFMLKRCDCGGEAHYESQKTTTGNMRFRAVCPDCGEQTAWDWTRHGAQEDWNGVRIGCARRN